MAVPGIGAPIRVTGPINAAGKTMTLETGRLAPQAERRGARPGGQHHVALHRRHHQAP